MCAISGGQWKESFQLEECGGTIGQSTPAKRSRMQWSRNGKQWWRQQKGNGSGPTAMATKVIVRLIRV